MVRFTVGVSKCGRMSSFLSALSGSDALQTLECRGFGGLNYIQAVF